MAEALSTRSAPVRGRSKAAIVRPTRFAVVFVSCFLLCVGIVLTPPVHAVDVRFSQILVQAAHFVIRAFGGQALVQGAILRDPASGFAVEMREGCNAVNVTFLLLSAMIAFPAPWKGKAVGLLAGGAIIQGLNIVRFISLYYIGQYSMTLFDFAHGYLWESLLVLDTLVVFWLWVNRVSNIGTAAGTAPGTAAHAGQ